MELLIRRLFLICIFSFTVYGCTGNVNFPVEEYSVLLEGNIMNFNVSQVNHDVIYAIDVEYTKGTLYRSNSAGVEWTEIRTIPAMQTVSINKIDPNLVFATDGG